MSAHFQAARTRTPRSRDRLRLALVLTLLPLGGCSLLFLPEAPSHDGGLDGGDGGTDAADAPMDAPTDARDGEVDGGFDGGPPTELLCADGMDDDEDGLVDCADLDCAGDDACCDETSSTDLVEDWGMADAAALLSLGFNLTPSGFSWPSGDSSELDNFPTSTNGPTAIVHECAPLATGRRYQMSFRVIERCTDECDDYVAFVLTPVNEMGSRVGLFDELAVRLEGDGTVHVTQAGREVGSPLSIASTDAFGVDLRISPAVGDDGVAIMSAEVTVTPTSGTPTTIYSGLLTDLDNLIRAGGCADVPGLYPAFEGLGSRAAVGAPVTERTYACANPSQFERPLLNALSAEGQSGTTPLNFSSPADPGWASGGIGAPALYQNGSAWYVLGEGTNDQPELEAALRVGYSVGFAYSNSSTWSSWTAPSVGPFVGDDPPSCVSHSCSGDERSVREPFALEPNPTDPQLLVAQEVDDSEAYELYAMTPTLASTSRLLQPDAECESLRDPAAIPVADGYWMLFTCVPATGGRSIHAVRLTLNGSVLMAGEHHAVLTSADLDFADDLFGAEPILDAVGERLLLRLWFLARRNAGQIVVGLATAETTTDALATSFPTLVPYAANPVLRPDDEVFGDESSFLGIAVAHDSDVGLRFLVARRVLDELAPGRRRFEYTPLIQRWSPSL